MSETGEAIAVHCARPLAGTVAAWEPVGMTTAFDDAVRRVHDEFEDHREVAAELVKQMTLEEKLGCLDGDLDAWPGLAEMVSGGYHTRTFPAAVV